MPESRTAIIRLADLVPPSKDQGQQLAGELAYQMILAVCGWVARPFKRFS
jgi:hypothetical protein